MAIVEKLGFKLPWKIGTVLKTRITEKWSREELERAEEIENRQIFTNFSFIDDGKSRVLIATAENKKDARLIASAPRLLNVVIADMGLIDALLEMTPDNELLKEFRSQRVELLEEITEMSWSDVCKIVVNED